MRASKALLPVLFSLGLAAWATAANASCYANFAGNCSHAGGSNPAYCQFDGTKTYNNAYYSVDLTQTHCGTSSVGMVFWEFDDISANDDKWDDLTTGNVYSDPSAIDYDAVIKMHLYCLDDCYAYKERYLLFTVIGPGDMYCNEGWN